MNWIKIEDRLPDLDINVLVVLKKFGKYYPDFKIAYISSETNTWWITNHNDTEVEFIKTVMYGVDNMIITEWCEIEYTNE